MECDTFPWELWSILDNKEGLRWAQLSCHRTYLFSLNSLVNDLSSLRSNDDQYNTTDDVTGMGLHVMMELDHHMQLDLQVKLKHHMELNHHRSGVLSLRPANTFYRPILDFDINTSIFRDENDDNEGYQDSMDTEQHYDQHAQHMMIL
ncbi:hypothetical protein ACH5RR_029147 [Cinchona calisaya]|uniref:Uncharacterized protein n=1 Tax=Cinchona calisaya TaxID=153742 RepID=A0ABD2YS91_9GENT